MPPEKFKLHEEAANEIRAAKDWYLAKGPDVAQHFFDALNHALSRTLSQPSMSARYLYSTRAVKIHRFSHVIVYKEVQGSHSCRSFGAHESPQGLLETPSSRHRGALITWANHPCDVIWQVKMVVDKMGYRGGKPMSVDSKVLHSDFQNVFDAAMRLPDAERAKLANKLSMTVDPLANAEWVEAWGPEIASRLAEIESGTAALSDWEKVRARLWKALPTTDAEIAEA